MKRFNSDIKENPSFNTVNGLSNKTFDPENIVSGRGATEDQLKVVGDVVQDLNDYIDEFGCSDCDEKYRSITDTLDTLEAQQEECCQNRVTQENLDAIIGDMNDRLDYLQTVQEECCQNRVTPENFNAIIADINDRLDDLEAQIEECCNKSFDPSQYGECDGNTITVSFGWNGSNPMQDGGQATAVSADPNRQIAGYFLLVHAGNGIYTKTSSYGGWSVSGTGAVTCAQGGHGGWMIYGIGATDTQGCEGFIAVHFPDSDLVGP